LEFNVPFQHKYGYIRDEIDSIKSWTGLSVEESVRMTENRDKWRKYIHGVVNPRIEDGEP